MEAKKQGTGDEDLSMEEILQSIRRIIADDSEEGKAAAVANGDKIVPASDILELTDMIEEDGSITDLKAAPKPVEAPKETVKTVDVLDNIDAALGKEAPLAKAETPIPAPITPAPQPVNTETKVEKMPTENMDALLSKTVADSTLSALSKLNVAQVTVPSTPTTPSPVFRSGTSVEDMVAEMIRPMLKDWLDTNLSIIVERIVEREVTRLTRR